MIGNKKYGSNPYRGKPIPKGRIEWAVEQAKSARQAARLLDVDFNTFKKYAVMYDLYEGVKNKSGKGISKGGNIYKGTHSLTDICDNKYPQYPLWKFKDRLIRACWKPEECDNCGFKEHRITDAKVPLVINFKDGEWDKEKRDYSLQNIELLCFNCYYLLVGNLNNRHKKI